MPPHAALTPSVVCFLVSVFSGAVTALGHAKINTRPFPRHHEEHMATNDKQVIFSLIGVGRVHPPKRQVLKDIYLSFYYGAKIGVLGGNGAGKSTLLRIIAGVDKDYLGEIT